MAQDIPDSIRQRTVITMDFDNYNEIYSKNTKERNALHDSLRTSRNDYQEQRQRVEVLEYAMRQAFSVIKQHGYRLVPTATGGSMLDFYSLVADTHTYRFSKIPKPRKKKKKSK